MSSLTHVVEGIVGEIDTSELVALDNMNVSDEIQQRYENNMNGTTKSLVNSLEISENLTNAGSYKKLEECVSHGRGRGQGKAGGRRRPLVSTPITEDWRSKTKSIEGVQTKNRCINYKEVYNDMKHGTILDRNLVNILEYFKSKAEEDMGMMCTDEPILSN